MNLFHCNQKGNLKQALFRARRPVYVLDEAKPAAESSAEAQKPKEQTEKPKPSGVPIDQQVSAENAAKARMTEAEKKIIDKYGGAIFGMNKIPEVAEKDYKNEVYVNIPKNPEKFVDKEGKPVPPRVIYYFHGNGGKIGADADNIMRQVEEMRAKGDNVILVMPQDNKGHWKDLNHPQAFKDMQKMVESLAGGKPIKDISISSFSGGNLAVEKVLKNLREQSDKDPESKKLYSQIRHLGFMDSVSSGWDEFARWAANKNNTLYSNYHQGSDTYESGNRMLMKALEVARGGDMSGIRLDTYRGLHGDAPIKFSEAMAREGGVPVIPDEQTRSAEVLSKEDILKGLEACRTPEEVQRFYLALATRGGISPDCLQERTYETVVNGKKVVVKMTGLISYGRPGNSVSGSMDGYTSQAIADMLGGELPTAKFHKRLYADKSVQKVPFFTGEELEARVNEDRKARGLKPLNINVTTSEGVKRNGVAMESADYMKAESERLEQWLKSHNIPKGTLMVGGRKVVLAPEDEGNKLLTFGGGLYTEPVKDENGKTIDIRASGRLVQGIGDQAHSGIYHDYAQGTEVMTGIVVEGREVPFEKIKNDPQYADIREELFGRSLGSRYQYPAWMREYVDEYRKHPPVGTGTSVSTPAPAPAQNPSLPVAKSEPSSKAPTSVTPGAAPSVGPSVSPPAYQASSTKPASFPSRAEGKTTPTPSSEKSPSQTPPSTETASYTPSLPPSGVTKPDAGAVKPAEGTENPPTIPYTSLGDSFTVGYDKFSRGSFIKLDYHNRMSKQNPKNPEMVGKATQYMKDTLIKEVLPNVEKNGIKTIVIGGGANDILGTLKTDEAKSKVEESIKANLGEIYLKCRKAGLNVIALTMPPFDRFIESRFKDPAEKARHYALWEAINAFIIGLEHSDNGPNIVVRAHELVGEQKPDGSWIRRQNLNAADGLHMQPEGLKLISRDIEKNLNSFEKAPASTGATGA